MKEPFLAARVAEMHYRDLLREAEHDRLCKEAMFTRSGFRDRFLLSAGEVLVSIGQGLQRVSLAAGRTG